MIRIQSKFTIITGLFSAAMFFTACNSNQSSDKNSDTTSMDAYNSPDTVQSVVHDTVVVTQPAAVPKTYPAPAASSQHEASSQPVASAQPVQPSTPVNSNIAVSKRRGRVIVQMVPVVKNAPIQKDNYGVYVYPQTYPTFPGGQPAIERYMVNHINYPKAALNNNKEGRVGVMFVVDERGRVRDAHVTNKLGRGLDEEALRVVSSMPHWNPGTVNGHPVKTRVTLPIIFQIEG